jgi:hypothetical protein
MAGVAAIRDVGDTLATILRTVIDPALVAPGQIRVAMPRDYEALDNANDLAISVFLYHVAISPELRNAPPRVLPDGQTAVRVLPVELGFLITPWARDALNALLLAGMITRAFHDRAELSAAQLAGTSWSSADTVQLVLESLPIEDHYRIWETTRVPYRLSLAYKARVVGIEGEPQIVASRVVEGRFDGANHAARAFR